MRQARTRITAVTLLACALGSACGFAGKKSNADAIRNSVVGLEQAGTVAGNLEFTRRALEINGQSMEELAEQAATATTVARGMGAPGEVAGPDQRALLEQARAGQTSPPVSVVV